MTLEIQIVSDTHLEFFTPRKKFDLFKPTAPILALLGDICCCGSNDDFDIYKKFIAELLPNYKHIIIVTGNHEYYYNPLDTNKKPTADETIEGVNKKIKALCATSPKLHFLNNKSLTITANKKKYMILGTTLWSFIPADQQARIEKSMHDYEYIYKIDAKTSKIRLMTAADVTSMFKKNYRYLTKQILAASKTGVKVIVLTHHKPFITKTYDVNSYDPAYMSDCSAIIKKPAVLFAWGHTHIAENMTINGVQMVSNPKGYLRQKTGYNPNFKVKV